MNYKNFINIIHINNMDKKFAILVVLLVIGWLLVKDKRVDASVVAQPGQLSENGKYSNMSPMKHDFFKVGFATFLVAILFTDSKLPLFDMEDVNNSTLGKGLIAGSAFALYHVFGEPMMNYLPKW
jgi:hypothetical protein